MRQPERDLDAVADIVAAGRLVLRFVDGVSRGEFDTNVEKQSAVIHQILVIGETTKRLSMEPLLLPPPPD